MSDTNKTFLYWGLGLVCSFLFIWAISALFTSSVSPRVWDDVVGRYVNEPGTVLRNRKEGWAEFVAGNHGLTRKGEKVLKSPGPKFFFWGDSYAEGMQVEAEERAVNVYNLKAGPDAPKGVTIADSGLSMADFFFFIPRYEALADDVIGHVFLLPGLRSIIPGKHLACHSSFEMDPMRFEFSDCPPSATALEYASLVNAMNIDFLHGLYKSITQYRFRFSVGNLTQERPVVQKASRQLDDRQLAAAWRFMLASLKKQTDKQLTFLYVPLRPALSRGKILMPQAEDGRKDLFRQICEEAGVEFIDLSNEFEDLYLTKGQLAQGFFNTPQGEGHLNANGQALVADGLYKLFDGGDR